MRILLKKEVDQFSLMATIFYVIIFYYFSNFHCRSIFESFFFHD